MSKQVVLMSKRVCLSSNQAFFRLNPVLVEYGRFFC